MADPKGTKDSHVPELQLWSSDWSCMTIVKVTSGERWVLNAMLSEGTLHSGLAHCHGRCLPKRIYDVPASHSCRKVIHQRVKLHNHAAHSLSLALCRVGGAQSDYNTRDNRIAAHLQHSAPVSARRRPQPPWRDLPVPVYRQLIAQASAAFSSDRSDGGASAGAPGASPTAGNQPSAPAKDPPSAGGEMPSQPEPSSSARPSEASPPHIIKMFHFVSSPPSRTDAPLPPSSQLSPCTS